MEWKLYGRRVWILRNMVNKLKLRIQKFFNSYSYYIIDRILILLFILTTGIIFCIRHCADNPPTSVSISILSIIVCTSSYFWLLKLNKLKTNWSRIATIIIIAVTYFLFVYSLCYCYF